MSLSEWNDETDTLLFFNYLHVFFSGNVFAYLSSVALCLYPQTKFLFSGHQSSFFSSLKASLPLHITKPRTSMSSAPPSLDWTPTPLLPSNPIKSTFGNLPQIHILTLTMMNPSTGEGLGFAVGNTLVVAECNLERLFWMEIWKYISVILEIFVTFDLATVPYE